MFYLGTLCLLILLGVTVRTGICQELPLETFVEKYRRSDLHLNGGRGYSESADSSQLGWGESYLLMNYIRLYQVTNDSSWLGKLCDHFDRMQTTMADHDGDGYAGWQTDRYSVAHLQISPHEGTTSRLTPIENPIRHIERAHAVTGHTYRLTFDSPSRYTVTDLETDSVQAAIADGQITEIPGITLKLDGEPQAGDGFEIETTAVEPLEYMVHEGMLLYPIARFIEIALTDANLPESFRGKAENYLNVILTNFIPKWEPYWMELPNNAGAYRTTDSPAERFPGRLLPHNQYAMHAQVYLVLQSVRELPELREKAVKMARYFRNKLRPTGRAWTWNYWDWGEGADEHSGPEDTSHASINVGFAIEAYHRGVIFDRADLTRFAYTLLDEMWNGSLDDTNVGDRVDSKTGDRYFPIRRWVDLCEFQPQVWEVCLALFRKRGEPVNLIPTMLYAQGISRHRPQ